MVQKGEFEGLDAREGIKYDDRMVGGERAATLADDSGRRNLPLCHHAMHEAHNVVRIVLQRNKECQNCDFRVRKLLLGSSQRPCYKKSKG